MGDSLLSINPEEQIKKITSFIKDTLGMQNKQNVVLGLSGGVDSSVSLNLLARVLGPDNIHPVSLPYFEDKSLDTEEALKGAGIPSNYLTSLSIKQMADKIIGELKIPEEDTLRRGNVMTRVRMTVLYDMAKKLDALVCGTENRSEKLLGYYTRFGDEASDFEPILHLYKTQVYELAKYLSVPVSIINKPPSANLWENQTDEGEFGFSYKEADPVLYLYFNEKKSLEEIEKLGFANAKKIIEFAKNNSYKHHTPYKT
ncbi:MAG: NH(3)-dependent NAD(+) synthetase [Candidatus Levybacteria bacterium GW2011_GWC2_40_7]|nr:MAG: NH(3)-dependent NAD(+) synthetase [Candidatus Levybacteria bacterium GW2011_GWC2_40_7]KKR94945.1 MAG: NH(3)-dependent NAD(+) synthetase [Candidatus Levybacteria bacterium GW2011_GWA2_41_15]HBB76142.1 NAD(+) synthetase [Candidatus Levybacteria bacterium]